MKSVVTVVITLWVEKSMRADMVLSGKSAGSPSRGDDHATTQRSDAFFAAEPFKENVERLYN